MLEKSAYDAYMEALDAAVEAPGSYTQEQLLALKAACDQEASENWDAYKRWTAAGSPHNPDHEVED